MILAHVHNAIRKVQTFSELLSDAVISNVSESYDVNTGSVVKSTTSYSVKGIIDNFSYKEVDDINVLKDDLKFFVLSNELPTVESSNGHMTIDSITYQILRVDAIHVGATVVAYNIHLRR